MNALRLTILAPAILNGEAGAVLERAIAEAPIPVEVVAFIVPEGQTRDIPQLGAVAGTQDVMDAWRAQAHG